MRTKKVKSTPQKQEATCVDCQQSFMSIKLTGTKAQVRCHQCQSARKKQLDASYAAKHIEAIKAGNGKRWWHYKAAAINATSQKRGGKRHVTADDLMAIAEKFNHCCAYCGLSLTTGTNPRRGQYSTVMSFDHVIPRLADPSNIVPSCQQCNALKRDLTVEDLERFLAAIKRLSPAKAS